jgi:hypothetical protein
MSVVSRTDLLHTRKGGTPVWGYYRNEMFYGVWNSEDEARTAMYDAGHSSGCIYKISLVNDNRQPVATATGPMAEFLALGQ